MRQQKVLGERNALVVAVGLLVVLVGGLSVRHQRVVVPAQHVGEDHELQHVISVGRDTAAA